MQTEAIEAEDERCTIRSCGKIMCCSRLTSNAACHANRHGRYDMPALCPIWRSDLEKMVSGLATDVG